MIGRNLRGLVPSSLTFTGPDYIEDGEDPVIALAHLIAAASWEAAEAKAPVPTTLEAKEQYG